MKTNNLYKAFDSLLIVGLFLLGISAHAYESEKKVNKTYSVSAETRIRVENKFGTVEVSPTL
jgi:CHASE3 domain sensor protein